MPARRFILHRLIRIVPAYWLYTAAMGLLLLIAAPMLPHRDRLAEFPLVTGVHSFRESRGYGLYPTLNVGWTLNYEMFFYLLFSMVFLFQQRHRPLIIAAALFAVSEVLARAGLISRFYGNDIIYEFLLGIGIGILYRRGWIKQALWLPLAGIAVGLYAINNLSNEQRLLNWGLPSALIVLSCISLEPYFQGNRLLKVLGDCSYSVYLLHVLVLYGGLLMAQRFGLNPYVVFAFCVPIIAIGARVSYEWIEKGLYRRMKAAGCAPGGQSGASINLTKILGLCVKRPIGVNCTHVCEEFS